MVIRVSSVRQVDTLIADLISDNDGQRDAAMVRLTVIGARAVGRLVTLADDPATPRSGRAAALRTLEAIGDPRALAVALRRLTDADDMVAIAAIDLARVFVRSAHGVPAVDQLSELALAADRAVPVRLAAIRALRDLNPGTLKLLLTALKADAVPEIAAAAEQPVSDLASAIDPAQCLADAAAGKLPDDAEVLGRAIAQAGDETPLPALQSLIDIVRERESSLPRSQRAGWTAARAAAHLALARRGSRLALYDLRETFERTTEPLAVEFVTAMTQVGDASCLEPLAVAYTQTGGSRQDWWPRHLSGAFRAILARERITRRHATMKKIEKRWGLEILN